MSGYVRIIGGRWRGKKLAVPAVPGLRPTPDRVRETLFNWLAPVIANAHCLDLYAGTGALGIEALSRGAASVTLIDDNDVVIHAIQKTLIDLHANAAATLHHARLPAALSLVRGPVNVVFIDPPYQTKLALPMCFALEDVNLLADNSYIYLETSDSIADQAFPANWVILKAKKTGIVRYYLMKRTR